MSAAKYYATIVLVSLSLVACDGVELDVEETTNEPSAAPDPLANSPITDLSAEPGFDEGFGDAFWAQQARNFPAFVAPPEIGAAHDASENINLGRWGGVIEWPQIATGAAHLPDGRLLTWSSTREDDFGGNDDFTHGSIFDPVTETFTDNPNENHNMFCAGISMLADGSVFTAGGGATITTSSLYTDDNWSLTNPLVHRRWYPESTTLPSGQVVTSLGTEDTAFSEIYTLGEGSRTLNNVSLQSVLDDSSTRNRLRSWFPALNVAPDGRLFHPGPTSELFSLDLYTNGAAFTSHGQREADDPHRLYNTTVMYDIGKMLIAGGGQPALDSALTIDINGTTPIVTPTESMTFARSMQDSIVLPNGQVLVIGGNSSGIQFSDEGTQLFPEIWDPETGQWTTLAPHSKPRNYHSTAMLLKDGRVAAMGSGLCGNCATNQQNGEIFEPPYLFNTDGTRAVQPQILAGASEAVAGEVIGLSADPGIESFSMVRLVALTHHHTTDQRYIPLSFTEATPGGYSVQLPSNFNVLIPGYYWVFALDANGVPSNGHTVRINVTAQEVPAPPASVVYEYYEGEFDVLPDFDSLTPVATGEAESISLAPSQQDDFFAFRFTATLSLDEPGEYTFYTTSDDGSALFVDGQMIVDNDGAHRSQERQGSVNLSAGNHEVVVTFFEATGGSSLSVQFDGPSITKQPLNTHLLPLDGSIVPVQPIGPTQPTTPITPATTVNQGSAIIAFDYYEGAWSELPDFDSLTPVLSGELDEFTTDPKLQNQFYGFRYTMPLYVPSTDQYTFYLASDDGSNLYVNGQLVVENDGLHGLIEERGTVDLAVGQYDIVVEYFNRTGGAELQVQFGSASQARQALLPSIAPEPVDVPVVPNGPDPANPGNSSGGNLLNNGNFQANLSDWSVCGGQANASNGSVVLSAGGCLFQEFNITPQAQYTLTCEANAPSDFTSMQLSVSDENFISLSSDVAVVSSATTELITATVTAPNGGAQGVVTLFAQTEASFDNCVVTTDTSAVAPVTVEPASNELLQNANFEDNLDDWFSCGGQQTLTANGPGGSNAVNLSNLGCLFQEFPITVGTSYELSCTGLSASDFSSVTLAFLDSNFQALDSQEIPVTSNTFQNFSAALTAPAGTFVGAVTLYADTDATFDSCALAVAGGVTPVAPVDPVTPTNSADNLLANGDFANGTAGWESCGGASSVVSQGTNNSDGLVLGTVGCLFQEFAAEVDTEYALSCSGRAIGFSSMTLSYSDTSFAALTSSEVPVPGTTFSTVSATETAPANTAQGVVTLYADDFAVFDDCAVVEVQ